MKMLHHRRLAAVAAVGLLAVLPACGDDDDGTAATTETTAAAVDDATAVSASGAWARQSAAMQSAGAIYLELQGGDADDALVEASVPADVAATVEIHETVMMDGDDGMSDDSMDDEGMGDEGMGDEGMDDEGMSDDSMDDDGMGMMQMREVGRIEVPAGTTVALEPGGLHIMLLELTAPLEEGATFDVTLRFESGVELVVPVEVRAS